MRNGLPPSPAETLSFILCGPCRPRTAPTPPQGLGSLAPPWRRGLGPPARRGSTVLGHLLFLRLPSGSTVAPVRHCPLLPCCRVVLSSNPSCLFGHRSVAQNGTLLHFLRAFGARLRLRGAAPQLSDGLDTHVVVCLLLWARLGREFRCVSMQAPERTPMTSHCMRAQRQRCTCVWLHAARCSIWPCSAMHRPISHRPLRQGCRVGRAHPAGQAAGQRIGGWRRGWVRAERGHW